MPSYKNYNQYPNVEVVSMMIAKTMILCNNLKKKY